MDVACGYNAVFVSLRGVHARSRMTFGQFALFLDLRNTGDPNMYSRRKRGFIIDRSLTPASTAAIAPFQSQGCYRLSPGPRNLPYSKRGGIRPAPVR